MTQHDNIINQKAKSWRPSVSGEASERLEETVEEASFYSLIRQYGATAEFLNICLKSGNEIAIPTTTIKRIAFNREDHRIIIRFDLSSLITISGRNLKELHGHLLRVKINEIREYPNDVNQQFNEDDLYISNIEMEDGEEKE